MKIIADIGATKMRIASVHNARSFNEPVVHATPHVYEEGIALIATTAQSLAHDEAIESVVAGVPGVLAADKRSLFDAPNLAQWNKQPLADDLEHALGGRVLLENDTALVGLGEAHFGAGQPSTILMYLTVSTGVNGVRIVDGAIDRSTFGFEIGDQYISLNGEVYTLESLISGKRIEARFGMPPRELGKENPLWQELARQLAYALHNSIVHWSPDTIVLGGSMFNDVGIAISDVERALEPLMRRFPSMPALLHSALGDFGGLYGALVHTHNLQQFKA